MHFNRGPGAHQRNAKRMQIVVAFFSPILVILGVPALLLSPPSSTGAESDVVLVMAGIADGRHELGADLIEQGRSQNFVVSNPLGTDDEVGTTHCRGELQPQDADTVRCLKPQPVTTAGEAIAVGELARQEGWTSITAVTNRPHARRVNLILEQCTDMTVSVVPIDQINIIRAPIHITREVMGYFKFWLTAPCS